jgi:hypothetical protein
LLTEQQVSRTWGTLFRGHELTIERVTEAESLLENLRPESPLRHRLATELDEIRKLYERQNTAVH